MEVNWFWLQEFCTLRSMLIFNTDAMFILTAHSLWTIKYSISIFLRSLTGQIWQRLHHKLLRHLHIFLAVTFFATVASDLAECQPFTHYWQVIPDPGPQCRQGYAQLFTAGILNIVTNLALIIFPIPMILKSNLTTRLKWSVILRLALPALCIFATINQLEGVVAHKGDQQRRSLLASRKLSHLLPKITSISNNPERNPTSNSHSKLLLSLNFVGI